MIEIPRAALTADDIAKEAEFFSFGTNDLTQMTFGFSRDDAGKFLGSYYENKIYEQDPFARLDQVGVGKLVEMAVEKGKTTRPDIKLGICGEHGGDPSSVEFSIKLDLLMYHVVHLEYQLLDLLLHKPQLKREKIRTQKRETKKIIKDSNESFCCNKRKTTLYHSYYTK